MNNSKSLLYINTAIKSGHHQRATKSSRLVSQSVHCGTAPQGARGSNTRFRGALVIFFFVFVLLIFLSFILFFLFLLYLRSALHWGFRELPFLPGMQLLSRQRPGPDNRTETNSYMTNTPTCAAIGAQTTDKYRLFQVITGQKCGVELRSFKRRSNSVITTYRRLFEAESAHSLILVKQDTTWFWNTPRHNRPTSWMAELLPGKLQACWQRRSSEKNLNLLRKPAIKTCHPSGSGAKMQMFRLYITVLARAILTNHVLRRCPWAGIRSRH